MTKFSLLDEKQIADLKLRALGLALSQSFGLSDPRAQSVADLVRDLKASHDPRAVALAEALGAFGFSDILMLVDRIDSKKTGGQKRPHINDALLVMEIIDRLAKEEKLEPIVRDLAKKADGAGTLESKAQRLKAAFRKIWKTNSEISTKK